MAYWKAPTMLISISAGFHTILSWASMVAEESWLIVDLFTGIQDGSVEVPQAVITLSYFQRRLWEWGVPNN